MCEMRVRDLAWEWDEDNKRIRDAQGMGILYRIIDRTDGTSVLRIIAMDIDHSSHKCTADAEAAAQADFERRVRAYLEGWPE